MADLKIDKKDKYGRSSDLRLLYCFLFQSHKIFGTDLPSPIRRKGDSSSDCQCACLKGIVFLLANLFGRRWDDEVTFLSEAVGISQDFDFHLLQLRDKSVKKKNRASFWVLLSVLYVNFLADIYGYGIITFVNSFPFNQETMSFRLFVVHIPIIAAFTILFYGALYILFIGVPVKLFSRFRDSIWCETICGLEILRLLYELDESVLLDYYKRKVLVIRLERIASLTLLIPLSYPYSGNRQKWVDDKFKQIYKFVRERQSWLYLPLHSTEKDLRSDFKMLARAYLTGYYDEIFDPQTSLQPAYEDKPSKSNFLKDGLRVLIVLMPIFIITALLFVDQRYLPFGKNEDLLGIILISWILLSIDHLLKLGILEGFIQVARGVRDLSR